MSLATAATRPKLWVPEDIAEYFGVPVGWIYKRTRKDGPEIIPHIKRGKYLRFDPESSAFHGSYHFCFCVLRFVFTVRRFDGGGFTLSKSATASLNFRRANVIGFGLGIIGPSIISGIEV